jgi:hypothetical protein
MAIKTFTTGEVLTASDTNTYLANSGLVAIAPTSVAGSGVTVSNATVTFSGSNPVNVNGVFSSTYKNYKVLINISTSSQVILSYRLRVSGADNNTGNYSEQRLIADSTTLLGVRATGQTSGTIGQLVLNDFSFYDCNLFQPFETTKTGLMVTGTTFVGGSYISDLAGQFGAATSFDGFSIFPVSGTITGTLSVYGFRT